MQTILEMFFSGKINTYKLGTPKNPEYKINTEQASALYDEFMSLLNDKQKELYENLYEKELDRNYIEDTQSFVNAFSLGANFMLEILCFRENLISSISK